MYERLHFTGFDDLKNDYFNNPDKIKKVNFFKKILLKLRRSI